MPALSAEALAKVEGRFIGLQACFIAPSAPPVPLSISSRGCPTCPDRIRLSDHEKVNLKMWILMKKSPSKNVDADEKVTLKM